MTVDSLVNVHFVSPRSLFPIVICHGALCLPQWIARQTSLKGNPHPMEEGELLE